MFTMICLAAFGMGVAALIGMVAKACEMADRIDGIDGDEG